MIDHLSLGTTDLDAAVELYRRALDPLGVVLQHRNGAEAAFGLRTDRTFWLYAVESQPPLPGMHVALSAASADEVNRAHAAAIGAGATSAREPGRRPELGETYYGSVFVDRDGHRIELVASVASR